MKSTTTTGQPDGLGTNAAAIWLAVSAAYELDEHENALLREVCRVTDRLDRLHEVIERDGEIVAGLHGTRVHPALSEARQQAVVLARLVASLRLPAGDEADQSQRRGGARGVYQLRPA